MLFASLPDIEMKDMKFDIVFWGYVIEHMKNGLELYHNIENLKQLLSEDGILIY